MKQVCLLGATGSIGTQTLDIIKEFNDDFCLVAFSFGNNLNKAIEIIEEFKPLLVSCKKEEDMLFLKNKYPNISFSYGNEGIVCVALYPCDNPVVVNALVGSVGLLPTYQTLIHNRDIYLANKESLVMGGELVTNIARLNQKKIIPIDSEHSSLAQLLEGKNISDVNHLYITASGGAFRDKTRSELLNVSLEDALKHPNWKMGEKITIDCATMMNKGFEIIEAYYLFNLPLSKITPLLHKESIIHALVEFNDGAIFAHMASSDMHIPIKYALMGPTHGYSKVINRLDITSISLLHFDKLTKDQYPCLQYAIDCITKGGYYPVILNASNEACVKLFLEKKISFLDIEKIVFESINNIEYHYLDNVPLSIESIYELDNYIKDDIYKKYIIEKGN